MFSVLTIGTTTAPVRLFNHIEKRMLLEEVADTPGRQRPHALLFTDLLVGIVDMARSEGIPVFMECETCERTKYALRLWCRTSN